MYGSTNKAPTTKTFGVHLIAQCTQKSFLQVEAFTQIKISSAFNDQ
jgi:hypothetical protein